MVGKGDSPDQAIAAIAASQHGVVTTAQLVALGLSRAAISKRAKSGRLHRLHQGVYAVGYADAGDETRWMAAVLACGDGAVLSHAAAAALWELLAAPEGRIDVSVPTQAGRKRRRGIRIHRRTFLAPCREATFTPAGFSRWDSQSPLSTTGLQRRLPRRSTVRRGIPVTTPAQTIEDLHGSVAPYLVRRARRQAEYLGLPLEGIESDGTRSDVEGLFLRLCRRHRLPPPEVNVPIGRWTVDFLWREQRLAVETDSYRTHRGSVAFEDDRLRDLHLRRAGFTVHRFTERQLKEEPAAVLADVSRALGRGGAYVASLPAAAAP